MEKKELLKKLKRIKLLYLEDEKSFKERTENYLSRWFKKIYSAEDGKDGFELYTKYKPDIVIADLNMPIVDGIEFIKKIRETDKKTRVLVTTAHTEKEYLVEAIELNITRYLTKPFNSKKLFEAFEKCVKEIESQ